MHRCDREERGAERQAKLFYHSDTNFQRCLFIIMRLLASFIIRNSEANTDFVPGSTFERHSHSSCPPLPTHLSSPSMGLTFLHYAGMLTNFLMAHKQIVSLCALKLCLCTYACEWGTYQIRCCVRTCRINARNCVPFSFALVDQRYVRRGRRPGDQRPSRLPVSYGVQNLFG